MSTSICHVAQERVKQAQDIFYGVQAGSLEYKDLTFPQETAIRNDAHPSGQGNLSAARDAVTWVESIDARYSEPEFTLFGTEHQVTGHSTDIY